MQTCPRVRSEDWLGRFRGRGWREGGAPGGREAVVAARSAPCCEPCGGGGTPTSTASCLGWPLTSAANAGEAEGQVLGATGQRRGLSACRWGEVPPGGFPAGVFALE